jgi:hypothetical protein
MPMVVFFTTGSVGIRRANEKKADPAKGQPSFLQRLGALDF